MPIKLTTNGPEMDAGQAATQTHAVIAAKGGGKSYTGGVFAEQLAAAGVPFIVFDPIGNWCWLRLDSTGKHAGIDVAVVGGEHGDVPLHHDQGDALGTFLVERNASAVLDISAFSKTKRKEFVADVCEAIYRAARTHRSPRMVIFEEAQLFAPQHTARGEERMLGAVTDIVRLGRNYGLGSMLITQRPQSVSKEVLNQVEDLLVGGLRGPHERKAIAGWVTEQGADLTAQLAELPTLTPGEFFQWSPSWLKWFGRVTVAKKVTFDGSSTPTLNGSALPVRFEPKDMDALRALLEPPGEPELGATVKSPVDKWAGDRVEAALEEMDDLRARLETAQDRIDALNESGRLLLARAERAERGENVAAQRFESLRDLVRSTLETIGGECEALKNEAMPRLVLPGFEEESPPAVGVGSSVRNSRSKDGSEVVPAQAPGRMPARSNGGQLQRRAPTSGDPTPTAIGDYEEELLACIAAYEPVTRTRLSILSGKSKASSTFADGIRALVRAELVTDGGGALTVTPSGKKRARQPTTPRGRGVLERCRRSLGDYDAATLDVLVGNRRAGVNRKQIAQSTGHSIASSTFADSIRRLKKLGLADEAGGVITLSEDARFATGL